MGYGNLFQSMDENEACNGVKYVQWIDLRN